MMQFYQIFYDYVPGFFPEIRQFHCPMSIVIPRHDRSGTANILGRCSPDSKAFEILQDGPGIPVPVVSVGQTLRCMKEFHASKICFCLDGSVNTARKG